MTSPSSGASFSQPTDMLQHESKQFPLEPVKVVHPCNLTVSSSTKSSLQLPHESVWVPLCLEGPGAGKDVHPILSLHCLPHLHSFQSTDLNMTCIPEPISIGPAHGLSLGCPRHLLWRQGLRKTTKFSCQKFGEVGKLALSVQACKFRNI